MTFFTFAWSSKLDRVHSRSFCRHGSQMILTSLPMRSFLFSITPQGAIPTVQIFRADLDMCSFRASPTCLATPGDTVETCLQSVVYIQGPWPSRGRDLSTCVCSAVSVCVRVCVCVCSAAVVCTGLRRGGGAKWHYEGTITDRGGGGGGGGSLSCWFFYFEAVWASQPN